jgi:hypothetical protein
VANREGVGEPDDESDDEAAQSMLMRRRAMKMHLAAVLIVALFVTAALGAWGAECNEPAPAKSCPRGTEIKIWGGLESKPKTAEGYKPETVKIGIGVFEMFEISSGAAGYTLPEREVAIYNRLNEILSTEPGHGNSVCVGRVRSAPTIYVGNHRLISVYKQDAQAAGMTQQELAAKWRDRIALVLPQVATANLAPKSPLYGSYEVAVGGTLLFRLRDKDGYDSTEQRGLDVERRVVEMLSDGRKGRLTAQAVEQDGEWIIRYGELKLLNVSQADASLNCSTRPILARRWANDLNAALLKLKAPTGDASATQ